jgi:hypothetical protein
VTAEPGDDYELMSVKEALVILAALQPTQVLATLRHNDFIMVAGIAFQGFRMDSGGYASPIVRRRLAEEAAKKPAFAAKLRELSTMPVPAEPTAPKPVLVANPQPNNSSAIDRYKLERDKLKQERDTANQTKQTAERQLAEVKRELLTANIARSESDRETERIKQRLERLERKQRQLETTNAALRRATVLSPTIPKSSTPEATTSTAQAEPNQYFVDAVRHLLTKDRALVALSLVNDVLRASPNDIDALEIKADALIKSEKLREASASLRSAIALSVQYGNINRAAVSLSKLMIAAPTPESEIKYIRDFMSALLRAPGAYDKLAEPLNALRLQNPASFALVKSLTPSSIQHLTFPEQTTYGQDSPLPLVLAGTGLVVTPRRLVLAIDRNDMTIVELAQQAIRTVDDDERDKIRRSVTLAACGDESYSRMLTPKFSRGAVVVDSSNVAWHGQEIVAQPPRIEYILAIRRSLRDRGYFPVVLIADANLPYVINDSATARRMVDDDQIQLVSPGSDADEHILREARRLHAPVVSNDYMADWDPDQTVSKIQYSFTPEGKPTIYF